MNRPMAHCLLGVGAWLALVALARPPDARGAMEAPRPAVAMPAMEADGTLPDPVARQAVFAATPRVYHRKGEDLVRATGKECRDCHIATGYPGGDFLGWEARKKWTLHWWMFSAAMLVAAAGLFVSLRIWRQGEGPSLHHRVHLPSVLRALFREVLLGERIRRQSLLRWWIFLLISVAFVALAGVFGLIVLTRFLIPLPGEAGRIVGLLLDFGADALGACILVGTMLALGRRILARGGSLRTDTEDVFVLLLLLGIVVTGFFLEACRLAVVAERPEIWASFVGALGAALLRPWEAPWTVVRFYVWIVHAGLVFLLVAYLPFSKLFHVLTSPVSILATASEAHYKQRE